MPVKKDGTGTRWVEMEFVTPGTPEQIWQAMATGPGNTAWFTRATIDERIGGEIHFDFGANGTSAGEVTAWEPPKRIAYVERDWSPGAPPVATEITITGRSGGKCLVRMVHSLFTSSDDWDDQLESFESGWPSFFEVLRIYMTHFAGRRAVSFGTLVKVDGDHLPVWKRLMSTLGLAGVDVGERWTTAHPQPLSGIVERTQQDRQMRLSIVRLDRPVPGIAMVGTYDLAGQTQASVTLYFYGDERETAAEGADSKWRDWLEDTFVRQPS
jgi:uncharacterized protein YndB with AHSA1/START domain